MKLLKRLSYCYSLKRMKQQNNIQMPVLKRFQVYVFGTGNTVLNSNNEITNIGHSVRIKNHVWLGKDVKIGKNTLISDNSIVGWGAVVTKKFTQNNIIIAGNPASVVKKDVNWDRAFPNSYINRES